MAKRGMFGRWNDSEFKVVPPKDTVDTVSGVEKHGGIAMYANETNPLGMPYEQTEFAKAEKVVDWTCSELAKITRLRLLSDPGYPAWDVSYCYGRLKDGTPVRVQLPFSDLPKNKVAKTILAHAKRDKVYAKGLGVFEAISKLW